MKLKLFEEFDNLYTQISEDEYDELCIRHTKFTDREKEVIKKHIHHVSSGLVSIEEKQFSSTPLWLKNVLLKQWFLISYNDRPRLAISKIDDEWFLVMVYESNIFYKCDQIEGLKKLLSDLF